MCVDVAVRDTRSKTGILDQAGHVNLDIDSPAQAAGAMPNTMPEAAQ